MDMTTQPLSSMRVAQVVCRSTSVCFICSDHTIRSFRRLTGHDDPPLLSDLTEVVHVRSDTSDTFSYFVSELFLFSRSANSLGGEDSVTIRVY